MSDPTIDPVEEANQQRKAKQEADDDNSIVDAAEKVVDPLVRPFAREQLTEEEVQIQREETDAEERSS